MSGRRLSRSELVAYCSYAIPLTALPAAIVIFIPPYYATVLGVPLAVIGTVFFILRLFDAITDPAMGWLLDSLPLKHRHRPWLIAALPIFLIGIGLLFFPIESLASTLYLGVAGLITYAAYTAGLITHQAWGSQVADSPSELSRLFGYREYGVIIGILGVFAAPAAVEALGNDALSSKVEASAIFLLSAFLVCTLTCTLLTPDEPRFSEEPAIRPSYRYFLSSPNILLVCAMNLLHNFGMVSISVLAFFLAASAFDAEGSFGLGNLVYFASAAAGMTVWMRLTATLGEIRTFACSAVYTFVIVATLPLFVDQQAYLPFMLALGLSFGAAPYLIRCLIGNYVNDYETQTSTSPRGAAFAAVTFCDKLGSGLAAGIALPLVGWLGFNTETTTSEGTDALLIVVTLLPCFASIAVLICLGLLQRQSRGPQAGGENA